LRKKLSTNCGKFGGLKIWLAEVTRKMNNYGGLEIRREFLVFEGSQQNVGIFKHNRNPSMFLKRWCKFDILLSFEMPEK